MEDCRNRRKERKGSAYNSILDCNLCAAGLRNCSAAYERSDGLYAHVDRLFLISAADDRRWISCSLSDNQIKKWRKVLENIPEYLIDYRIALVRIMYCCIYDIPI